MQRSARFRLEFIKELPVQESMRRLGYSQRGYLALPDCFADAHLPNALVAPSGGGG